VERALSGIVEDQTLDIDESHDDSSCPTWFQPSALP
jgi:hypothetical protein